MPNQFFPIIGSQGIAESDSTGSIFDINNPGYPFFVNGYFEKTNSLTQSRQFMFMKRPGVRQLSLTGTAITSGYKIQGFCAAPDRTHAVFFANNGAAAASGFISGTAITGFTAQAGWTATGPTVFTTLDVNTFNGSQWAVTDFTKGAVIDASGVWTVIANANFTGLTKTTNFVALDGYLFIGTSNGRIYNSDLNVPTSWTATSFLTPSDVPGQITWLAKIRNYLIVFKERSVEFFQDAGNPAPGSPLEAAKQLNRAIGCILPSSIQEVSDGIIFAGSHGDGVARIYKINRDTLQIAPISNRLVEQGLSVFNIKATYSADATALGQYNAQSQVATVMGKEFYIVNCSPSIHNSFGTASSVWDNDLQVWTSWSSALGAANTPDLYGFVPSQAQTMNSGSSFITGSWFVNNQPGTGTFMFMEDIMLGGTIAAWVDGISGVANTYTFGWTSDIIDFGTRARKFMDAFELYYTCRAGNVTGVSGTITLTYRDINFNTSATLVTRTLNIDTAGSVRAIATRLGSFRRRVFSIIDQRNSPLALWGFEITYNQGETEGGRPGVPS